MRQTPIIGSAFFVLILIIALGVSSYTLGGDEPVVSAANTKKSHEFGTDCFSCHRKGGKAKAIFTVAGSVLDEAREKIYKNPVIKLYTERRSGGDLVATIRGDALGNLYSTEEIDFSVGLYPVLEGTPGVAEPIKYMMKPIFTGSCNSCHGPSAEKLGID